MLKKLHQIFTSRVLWIGLLLLIEIGLLALFVYAIAGSIMLLFNMRGWQVAIIVLVFFYIMSLFTIIYIVNSHVKGSYKMAWLMFVAIVPFFGCFFYLLFGNKKVTYRQVRKMLPIIDILSKTRIDRGIIKELTEENPDAIKMAEYITNATGSDLYKNSQVTYFKSGEDVFPEMLKELEKAKEFIFIEYFIISPGLFWDSILKILVEKVKSGVEVKVMYDDIGSAKTLPFNYDKYLKSLGIDAQVFHKFKPIVDVKVNNRDHRKIMVIDGKVAFSGGLNLADEYINKISPFGYWKDNAIKIIGEAVHGMTGLFITQWLMVSEADLTTVNLNDQAYVKYFPDNTDVASDGYVQPYGDLPYNQDSVGEQVYLNLLARANKYVYITTPYLIIDDQFVNALITAKKQGIDVRIITPGIPDKKTVFGITRSHYRLLIKNDIKIYEYKPGFVHMKMFIVDDIFAVAGTINLDYRSLYLHAENATFMYKTSCIKDMKQDFLDCMKVSEEITYKVYNAYAAPHRFMWAVLRLFAPLF